MEPRRLAMCPLDNGYKFSENSPSLLLSFAVRLSILTRFSLLDIDITDSLIDCVARKDTYSNSDRHHYRHLSRLASTNRQVIVDGPARTDIILTIQKYLLRLKYLSSSMLSLVSIS